MKPLNFEWEKIFSSIPDAVAVVDRDYRFAWVNSAMESFLGLPREKIIGQSCHSLIHKTDKPIEDCLFKCMKESLRRESFEVESPENKLWLKVTVDPVVDAGGSLVGAIHYFTDITPIKEAEKAADLEIRRLGLLNRLGMLVLEEPELDAVLKKAMRDVCQSMGLSRSAVRIFGDPERTAEFRRSDFPPAGPDFSVYRSFADRGWDPAGENVVVNDVRKFIFRGDRREEAERFRVGALLGIPIQGRQEQIGFLFLCREQPYAWTGAEIAIAEAVTREIAMAVHHSKVFHSQRELADRLVSLMNNIPGVVYRGLRDWSIVFIGADVRRMTGYRPEELISGSMSWRSLIHPEDLGRVKQVFREAVRERRRVLRVEYRALHRDGSIRWVADRRQLIYDGQGNFTHVDGLLLDVTDRKEAEDQYRESERRFRAIADTASDAIVSADFAGRIVFFNRSAEKMFGYKISELEGKNLVHLMPERYRSAHEQGMARALETGVTRILGSTVELHGLRRNGTEFPIELSLASWKTGGSVFFTGIIRDITARKNAAEELRIAHDKLDSLVKSSPVPVVALTNDGIVTMWNPAAERVFGWAGEEVLGRLLPIVPEDRQEEFQTLRKRVIREDGFSGVEVRRRRKDGTFIDINLSTAPMRDALGNAVGMVGIFEDVTDRRRMEKALRESEEQLRQSQKIEAIGRLAGGVAHDFNNLLTAIRGYSDLLLHRLEAGSPLRREVAEIQKAGERATSLTRQLLAFSRKQVLQPKVLDLNAIVDGMNGMLRRLIGEDIDLVTALRPGLWNVKVDPGQIEQVIMNLVVNARDAMPKGGKLTVETANVDLGDTYVHRHAIVKAGPYVMLAISDTGEGMSEAVKSRLFEPFFTTKDKGKGTGLGLSTVYGIVKQSGGYIWVYSEIGKGTTFKVYFPRIRGAADSKTERGKDPLPSGKESVLVVEDEEIVRSLVRTILKENGYTVLTASDGDEALKIGREHKGPIHLIVTDVVMPKMGGRQAAESLAQHLPGVKVLYMSGYTDDAIVHHGVLDQGIPFLQKPFTPESLLRKVREVLDNSSAE